MFVVRYAACTHRLTPLLLLHAGWPPGGGLGCLLKMRTCHEELQNTRFKHNAADAVLTIQNLAPPPWLKAFELQMSAPVCRHAGWPPGGGLGACRR
jgi:hypothetical protein